jgi:quercetin dioxygenase-like cupin family protein
MNKITLTLSTLALFITMSTTPHNTYAQDKPDTIQIIRTGDVPSAKAPSNNFTGNVRVEMLFNGSHPARLSSGIVTFEPGARTNWHTHDKGQMLYILSGMGQVQEWGGKVIIVRSGDTVWFPAGVKHWHGATKDNAMSHLAISPIGDDNSTVWLEKVTDIQFNTK